MTSKKVLVLLLVVLCLSFVPQTRGALRDPELFSPYTAKTFHKIAYEICRNPDLSNEEVHQTMMLLSASTELDTRAEYAVEDILKLGSRFTDKDYSRALLWALEKYVKDTSDLEVIRKAIRSLLEKVNTREQREVLLTKLLNDVKEKNNVLASELATHLAILAAEKNDLETAIAYLMQAYDYNPYNKLAFFKLDELNKMTDRTLESVFYAKHLRRSMVTNPMDIDAAIAFAGYMERLGIYSTAASAYEYSAELFEYLYPEKKLPASIYLPWSITSYNTRRGRSICLQIARNIRQSGRFDIILEAIAGNAARKMGDIKRSEEILKIGLKAEEMLGSESAIPDVTAEQVAWFYSFASPNTVKALVWAKRAYSSEPESASAKAIYAYALATNAENEKAKELASDIFETNQIASVAMALSKLDEQDRDAAVEILKSAAGMDPASLAGEKARILLKDNGSDYINPVPTEVVLQAISADFGEDVVPRFLTADKIISAKLNLTGSEFPYGKDLDGKLVITNNSPGPIVISDNGLFKGNIRVDAVVSGDISVEIPELINKKIQIASPIEPGDYISFPLDLITGPLRSLVFTYPQASLEIEFTAYLDPVVGSDGSVRNSLSEIEPARTVTTRSGEVMTRRYLMQRLDALSKGQMRQRIRSAQLFAGLLMEQYAMERSKLLYQFTPVERRILIDAIRRSLADESWTVRVQVMAMLLQFQTSLDFELTRAVSENFDHPEWPVRMLSLYLLSKHQGDDFKQVLDWAAKYDSQRFVRNMAIALGADEPPKETEILEE